ncbi:DEAD/DEAH box helicase [Candidatus Parcubacteria bacterium]|nr:MAG: DEAD/DEAH box helicase [Candidatus Parcubacteria bacterium]
MTTFKELGLNSDIMKGLDDLGFVEPSPVQAKAIPFILKSKKDLIALAQTGTGKTAAFSLPILNQIKADGKTIQTIILSPTRELAIQICADIKNFSKYNKNLKVTPVYGGEKIDIQINALRRGTNIVVGTPGRVHDLIRRKVLRLHSIRWVVLDEADEMLDMGFKDDLDAILAQTPEERKTFLFSATMSKSVANIAMQYMRDADEISVGEKNIGAEKVSHEYYMVGARDRFEALKRILDYLPGVYGIVFCRTRREAQQVDEKLKASNYDSEALHGDIAQASRTRIMDRFKKKQVRLLVATDVAARGIDVNDLSHVINFNLPDQNEAYTHRTGRTGRAKKSGVAITIITPREQKRIRDLEKVIGKQFDLKKVPKGEDVYKKLIDNFVVELETESEEKGVNDKYFDEIVQRLSKINKEDLIKRFISQKFSQVIKENKNVNDLNAEEKKGSEHKRVTGNKKIKINFGKKHGLDVKGLFGLINSSKNLKGVEIGAINIRPEMTIFGVEEELSGEIKKELNELKYRGKRILATITDEDAGPRTFSGRRGGGSGGRRNRPPRGRSKGSGGNRPSKFRSRK